MDLGGGFSERGPRRDKIPNARNPCRSSIIRIGGGNSSGRTSRRSREYVQPGSAFYFSDLGGLDEWKRVSIKPEVIV